MNPFVHFLLTFMAWQFSFEINWPLKVRQIRNDYFKPTFLPKKELTNSTLLLVHLFLFVFWKKLKTPKDISKLTDLYLQFNMQYTLWNGVFWLSCKGQEMDFIFICLRFMIMHKNSSHPLDHLPNDILFCAGTSSLYFVNPVRQCNGSI